MEGIGRRKRSKEAVGNNGRKGRTARPAMRVQGRPFTPGYRRCWGKVSKPYDPQVAAWQAETVVWQACVTHS